MEKVKDQSATSNHSVMVSAIVSAYKSERFMRGCLQDLTDQTAFAEGKVEIIVVDSGSPQKEGAIVREFQDRFSSIRYLRTEKRENVYAAWNRGIQIANGKYITNANTDDRHARDAFERMTTVLEMRPDVALVYADVIKTRAENETFERCTETGRFHWHGWDRRILLNESCFMGPQPMWRRRVHDLYGYFDENLVTSGDYEFWLRISQSFDFFHIRMPLGLYLERPDSIEHLNAEIGRSEDAWIKHLYRRAAEQSKIVRCVPLDTLKALSNGRPFNSACLQDAVAELDTLVGERQEFKGNERKCLTAICPDFPALRERILAGERSPQAVRRFHDMGMALMVRRQNETAKTRIRGQAHGEGRSEGSAERGMGANHNCTEKTYAEAVGQAGAGNIQAAQILLERLVAAHPEHALAHNDLGVLLYQMDEKDNALAHYEKAAKLEPSNLTFQKNLAECYWVGFGRLQDAMNIYVNIITAYPEDAEALLAIGCLCDKMEKSDDAVVFYQRALEVDPSNVNVHARLGLSSPE
jgi:glycosyltransferase involved in cell wall biosynthesis/Flp pilus assembly protein TadD